ncbi:DUF4345 domain-containing protein [Nocardia panacis]|uniref:DUF4345 domain-containing protein n=1 Tax=Nocardia panacis TaxID=2340916 RepID=A0A3A4KFR0_9NOCA|nr:DUF4345 domain-containing protein [Nocardia panacis]RJO74768.1 DUF4345 domain-containing protein [Nocardia panacis]
MTAWLKGLSWTLGVACVGIGLLHLAAGTHCLPDMGVATATADSQARFLGAIFAGYGAAWIWAVRQNPIPAWAIRWLAGIFLLGALGRFVSLALDGVPHWFILVLTAFEVVLPPVFFWLAAADERRASRDGQYAGAV